MSPRRRAPRRNRDLDFSEDDYTLMLDAQGGRCAICGATPKTRRLHVDHEHRPPYRVRGLLCHRCNRALPSWVTEGWCVRAAAYLLSHRKLAEREEARAAEGKSRDAA